MAEGTWTEVVSATTQPGGGSTATVVVIALASEGYSDTYSDIYGAEVADTGSGGSTAHVSVVATGGGTSSETPETPPVVVETTIRYSLVVVARTPQAAGAPTLEEIGELTGWSGLHWEEAINGESSITATVDPHAQPAAVKSRLADLVDGSELWVYRNGVIVAAGPIVGLQAQASQAGLVTNIQARSLWHYVRRWWVEPDTTLTYTSEDQFDIVRGLIDYYQALQYGHVGLTIAAGSSGVDRDRTYAGADNHNIGQRIEELAAVNNGFDFRIDPASRELQLGVIGTITDVVLDRRNVADPRAFMSTGPADLASEAYSAGEAITSHRLNVAVRERFGRFGAFGSFPGVSVQSTLDDHAQRMLDDRDEMFYEPGPDLIPVAGASIGDFSAGDTIEMAYDYGFATLVTIRQVIRRSVSVTPTGDESFAVGFARGDSLTVPRILKGLQRRVSELEART